MASAGLTVLIAFAVWFVVIKSDGSSSHQAAQAPLGAILNTPTPLSSPDYDVFALIDLTNEATEQARKIAAHAVLRQLSTDWVTRVYDFRFTETALAVEIIVEGPFSNAGLPRWQVHTASKDSSNLLHGPAVALDIAALQAGPQRVAEAIQGRVPGLQIIALFVVPEDVSANGRPHWTGFGNLPGGILRCDLVDSASRLQPLCPHPPSQPPAGATP